MRKIKDVLRLKLDTKMSHQQIAAALGVSKGVVTKYVGLAATAGLDWATVRSVDEAALEPTRSPRGCSSCAASVPSSPRRSWPMSATRNSSAGLCRVVDPKTEFSRKGTGVSQTGRTCAASA